jgi:hypothetical protein
MTQPPTLPDLPPEGNKAWYPHYSGIDATVRWAVLTLALLAPENGPVITVAGLTPDPVTGDISAEDLLLAIQAMPLGYQPDLESAPSGTTITVVKDPITGNWPYDWDPVTKRPIYLLGSPSTTRRPTARPDIYIRYRGWLPQPNGVDSGDGGMLRNVDEFVPMDAP